jgi:hypothetical protein
MNKETAAVYCAAIAVAAVTAYAGGALIDVARNGLASIGVVVIAWHLFDTVNGALADHYAPKPAAPADKNSAL